MSAPLRVLVLRAGALGDVLLTVPLLDALRRLRPSPRLTLVAPGAVGELARAAGWADAVLPFESAALRWLWSDTLPVPDGAAWRVDAAIGCLDDPGGRLASRLRAAGAARVVTVSPLRPARHVADLLLGALPGLGLDLPQAPPPPPPRGGRTALAPEGPPGVPAPRLALHPGSGSAAKNWPLDGFLALARAARAMGLHPFFTTGEADAALEEPLRPAAEREGWAVVRNPPLTGLARLLRGAAAYVGNDSGVTHLAAVLGVPTLALFGPTDPALWAPRGPRVAVARAEPGRALAELPVSRVRDGLAALLARA